MNVKGQNEIAAGFVDDIDCKDVIVVDLRARALWFGLLTFIDRVTVTLVEFDRDALSDASRVAEFQAVDVRLVWQL